MFGRRVYVRSGISMYPEHPPIRSHHETLASILSISIGLCAVMEWG